MRKSLIQRSNFNRFYDQAGHRLVSLLLLSLSLTFTFPSQSFGSAEGQSIKIENRKSINNIREAQSANGGGVLSATGIAGGLPSNSDHVEATDTCIWLANTQPLELKDALNAVLTHNRMVLAALNDEDAAKANLDYADSFALPRFDLSGGYTYSNNPVSAFAFRMNQGRFTQKDFDIAELNDPDFLGNLGMKLTVSYPLYTGGRIELGKEAALNNIEATVAATKETTRGMAGELIQAYLGGALLVESIKVMDESVTLAESHVSLADSFYRNGVVIKSDLLAAQVFVAMIKQERERYLGSFENVNVGLNVLMDRDLDLRYSFVYDFTELPSVLEDSQYYDAIALARRPDLVKHVQMREALEKMMNIESRTSRPEVGLYGEVQYSDNGIFQNGSEDATIGVYAAWNLFDGGERKSKYNELKAKLKGVDEKISMLKLGIRSEVKQALIDYRVAINNLLSTEAIVAQAEESLRIIANRYREGASTALELQDAETMLKQGKLTRLVAMHDVHLASFNLRIATGEILDDIVMVADGI